MHPLYLYLLKTIACSGVLYVYYRLALYNRHFHQWNRFYLLAAVLLSILLPLLHLELPARSSAASGEVVRILNVVTIGNGYLHEDDTNAGKGALVYDYIMAGSLLVSCVLLSLLAGGLMRLYKLYHKHPREKFDDIRLILTQEKDAPFSFFRNIFWNTEVDIQGETGARILQHEITHVRQWHTVDRMLMNIILVIFWFNPFYWLVRKEMTMVHEFIADEKIVRHHDMSAFSDMVLSAIYPRYKFGTTSNFSSSSIKRRLLMLTKMNNPRVSYASRLFLLPVLVLVFGAFALKSAQHHTGNIALTQPITVVIDAGHGGSASGIRAADGTLEKNLTLSIAKKIMQLNQTLQLDRKNNINVVLTRQGDVDQPQPDRVQVAVDKKADMFISLHINSAPASESGFECYVSARNAGFASQSRLIGSLLMDEISKIYEVSKELKQRPEKGIWVLDAPAISYPSLLVECGNLNNDADRAFITNESNQEKIAGLILNAIASYAASAGKKAVSSIETGTGADSIPLTIKRMDVNKDNIKMLLSDNKMVNINRSTLVTGRAEKFRIENPETMGDSTLIIVDDKVYPDFSTVDVATIKSLSIADLINGGKHKKVMLISSK